MFVVSLTNVILWHIDISLDSVVYRVVLGVYMKEDFPLVFHIANFIEQKWKFVFKSKIYYVQTMSTRFMTKPVTVLSCAVRERHKELVKMLQQ